MSEYGMYGCRASRWYQFKWRLKRLLWYRWVYKIEHLRTHYYYNSLGYPFDEQFHVWTNVEGRWCNVIPKGKANWYGKPKEAPHG